MAKLLYRILDSTRDYTFGMRPQAGHYTDTNAVIQAIVTRLNLLLGEWWEDQDEGLALHEEIVGQYVNEEYREHVTLLLTERIAQTQGVDSVTDATLAHDPKTRELTYHATVTTIWGERRRVMLGFDGFSFILCT